MCPLNSTGQGKLADPTSPLQYLQTRVSFKSAFTFKVMTWLTLYTVWQLNTVKTLLHIFSKALGISVGCFKYKVCFQEFHCCQGKSLEWNWVGLERMKPSRGVREPGGGFSSGSSQQHWEKQKLEVEGHTGKNKTQNGCFSWNVRIHSCFLLIIVSNQ